MEVNNFDVLKEMSEQDLQTLILHPNNAEELQTRKNGWGFMKIGIDNKSIFEIIEGTRRFALLSWDVDDFDRIKKELENKK